MKHFFTLLFVLLACVGCQAGEISADWPETFTVGVFAGDDATDTLENQEPLRLHLEEKLGIPVELITGTSYSAVVEAMKSGRVDAMRGGSAAFVLAEQEAGAIPLATYVENFDDIGKFDPSINPYYVSIFVTKKGYGIATLADLAGADVAFVDPASTSGRLAPLVRLIEVNDALATPDDVDEWLNPLFAGSHNAALAALINDQVAAVTTYEGAYIAVADENLADVCGYDEIKRGGLLSEEEVQAIYDACPEGHLVVFAQTAPIPNPPFAISPDLPASLHDAVRDALLSTADDPEFIQAYEGYFVAPEAQVDGIETIDAFYDIAREISRLAVGE